MRVLALVLALLGTASPRLTWRIDTPARGTPAIDESAIFFLTSGNELVRASRDGVETWRSRIADRSDDVSGATVLLGDDVVVAGDYDIVAAGRVDGKVRWRFHPSDGYGPGLYLGAIIDGLVFAGSPSGRVYAIDLRTGQPRWSALLGAADKTTAFRPMVDGERVYAGYTDFEKQPVGGLVALDRRTGREVWRTSFPSRRKVSPGTGLAGGPLAGGTVIIAADAEGIVFGFDKASGALAWSIDDPATPVAGAADFRALVLAGDTLVATSTSGTISAYDLGSRTRRWQYDGRQLGSPAFQLASDAGRVFVPYPGVGVVALDTHDGREVWRTGDETKGSMWPPLISAERIYVTTAHGLLAYARTDR